MGWGVFRGKAAAAMPCLAMDGRCGGLSGQAAGALGRPSCAVTKLDPVSSPKQKWHCHRVENFRQAAQWFPFHHSDAARPRACIGARDNGVNPKSPPASASETARGGAASGPRSVQWMLRGRRIAPRLAPCNCAPPLGACTIRSRFLSTERVWPLSCGGVPPLRRATPRRARMANDNRHCTPLRTTQIPKT